MKELISTAGPKAGSWSPASRPCKSCHARARELFERDYLRQINRFGGNISKTAALPGWSLGLHRKLKSLGIPSRPRARVVKIVESAD